MKQEEKDKFYGQLYMEELLNGSLRQIEDPKIKICVWCCIEKLCDWEITTRDIHDARIIEKITICNQCAQLLFQLKEKKISSEEYFKKRHEKYLEYVEKIEELKRTYLNQKNKEI